MSYPNRSDLDAAQATLNKYPYTNTPSWHSIVQLSTGNCKNYVIGKAEYLLDNGWPLSTIRVGICNVEPQNRQYNIVHAVLVVAMPDGDEFILDQRQSYVCTIDELARMGYEPIRIQRFGGAVDFDRWIWD